MKKLRIYLDNCCFNRPFDNQEDAKVRLETEAKLQIQSYIFNDRLDLVWSYVLDYENSLNPFEERRKEVEKWKGLARENIKESVEIIKVMNEIISIGVKPLDALHISCSVSSNCDAFITVDHKIINKREALTEKVAVMRPGDFLYLIE